LRLIMKSRNISDYLKQTEVIDYRHPLVAKTAEELSSKSYNEVETARAIYEFVRDSISHSADISGKYVTCRASEVLERNEGICYAKSHLLAALMRFNSIQCGFCYQLLRLGDETSPLVIHGLNAIYLRTLDKWVRLDSRGNKPGVDAQFSIEDERLAFEVRCQQSEKDFPYIFPDPDLNVITALKHSKTLEELWSNLPDSLHSLSEKPGGELKIAYLAEYPEHVQTCTSWIYGLWTSQSGAEYESVYEKFQNGANTAELPITLIALAGSKPAGTVSLWKNNVTRPDLSPWLAALYVHPFHRNKGISLRLIERVIEEARRLGFKELYLVTEEAKALYERFGWREMEQTTTPYGGASLMRKRLV